MNPLIIKRISAIILLLSFVIVASGITDILWGHNDERTVGNEYLITNERITVAEYGKLNSIPHPALLKIFNTKQATDTNKSIGSFGYDKNELIKKTRVNIAEFREEHSKNPFRFTLHFILSILLMAVVFYLMRKSLINQVTRKYLYLISIMVFGLGFNSNPSPMGPLKDTISLLGNIPEILHPRLFALLTYLIIVVVANKFICSWVCQFGVLQDLLFRLNRNKKDCKNIVKQYKIPFILSNSIRITFFFLTTIISSLWAINIIDSINPFAVFSGLEIELFGWCFVGVMLAASIFVYRPWCYLFCPFGLLSWLFEKLSIYKITVNYKTCTSCNACAVSCPSDAMEAILNKKKNLPDCFSCGTCINACPEGSIKFDVQRSVNL
jgi:ferredoxin